MSKITKHIIDYHYNGKPKDISYIIKGNHWIEFRDCFGKLVAKEKLGSERDLVNDADHKYLLEDLKSKEVLKGIMEFLETDKVEYSYDSIVSKKLAELTELEEGDTYKEYDIRNATHSDRVKEHLRIIDDMIQFNIDVHYATYAKDFLENTSIEDMLEGETLDKIYEINTQYVKDRLASYNSDTFERIRVKDDKFRWEQIKKAQESITKHRYQLLKQDFYYKWEVMYDLRVKLIERIIIIPNYEDKFWLAVKIAFEKYAHKYSVNGSNVKIDEYDKYAKAWENQIRLSTSKEVVDLAEEWKIAKDKLNHL